MLLKIFFKLGALFQTADLKHRIAIVSLLLAMFFSLEEAAAKSKSFLCERASPPYSVSVSDCPWLPVA